MCNRIRVMASPSAVTLRIAVLVLAFWTAPRLLAQAPAGNLPQPPKPDVPYLLHATKLIETEVAEAREEKKKSETIYSVSGVSSPAKTPLAEPIFVIRTEKLQADRLELYRMEVKGGRREIAIPERRGRNSPRPIPLAVRKLADNLWRVEASATLENGQYALTPAGSNTVFLFEVY